MSFSKFPMGSIISVPIAEFQYRQTAAEQPTINVAVDEALTEHELRVTEETLRQNLSAERAAGVAETEAKLRTEYEQRSRAETLRISRAVEHFEKARKEYFARVEAEVVKLALSIAAKILHRESQVDPMLVAALVQIALGQLKDGTAACIRVRPEEVKGWQQHFSTLNLSANITVLEDDELEPKDCILGTELGSVNFSLEMQLKEVEKGFFDILAQRPAV